jgi:hypothetical protein
MRSPSLLASCEHVTKQLTNAVMDQAQDILEGLGPRSTAEHRDRVAATGPYFRCRQSDIQAKDKQATSETS